MQRFQAGPWTNPTINSVLFNKEYEILMKSDFFFSSKFHFWLRRHLIWLLLNSFRIISPKLGLSYCPKWTEVNYNYPNFLFFSFILNFQ